MGRLSGTNQWLVAGLAAAAVVGVALGAQVLTSPRPVDDAGPGPNRPAFTAASPTATDPTTAPPTSSPSKPAPSPSGKSSKPPRTTSTKSGTAGPTKTKKPEVPLSGAVGLSAGSVSGHSIPVTANVKRKPPSGKTFWLVMIVDFGGGDVQWYPHRKLPSPAGSHTYTISIPGDADPSLPRTLKAYYVSAAKSSHYQALLGQPENDRKGDKAAPCSCTSGSVTMNYD